MTNNTTVSDIKRAQKERHLLRLIADLIQQAAMDDPRIADLYVTRVKLSPDKGNCMVYFYTIKGKEYFDEKLNILKLYKPSLRKAIATSVPGRYVPDFRFAFDDLYEKVEKIEQIFEQIKTEKP
jgi:ribosome-binding factor A